MDSVVVVLMGTGTVEVCSDTYTYNNYLSLADAMPPSKSRKFVKGSH